MYDDADSYYDMYGDEFWFGGDPYYADDSGGGIFGGFFDPEILTEDDFYSTYPEGYDEYGNPLPGGILTEQDYDTLYHNQPEGLDEYGNPLPGGILTEADFWSTPVPAKGKSILDKVLGGLSGGNMASQRSPQQTPTGQQMYPQASSSSLIMYVLVALIAVLLLRSAKL